MPFVYTSVDGQPEGLQMDVQALVHRIEQELERAERHRQDVQIQLDAANGRVTELRNEMATLSRIIGRYLAGDLKAAPPTLSRGVDTVGDDWTNMSRGDAIVQALTDLGRPASPQDVAYVLASHGRSDEFQRLRGSIYHLAEKGRIARVSKGTFALLEPTAADPDLDWPDPAIVPIGRLEGGDDHVPPTEDQADLRKVGPDGRSGGRTSIAA